MHGFFQFKNRHDCQDLQFLLQWPSNWKCDAKHVNCHEFCSHWSQQEIRLCQLWLHRLNQVRGDDVLHERSASFDCENVLQMWGKLYSNNSKPAKNLGKKKSSERNHHSETDKEVREIWISDGHEVSNSPTFCSVLGQTRCHQEERGVQSQDFSTSSLPRIGDVEEHLVCQESHGGHLKDVLFHN